MRQGYMGPAVMRLFPENFPSTPRTRSPPYTLAASSRWPQNLFFLIFGAFFVAGLERGGTRADDEAGGHNAGAGAQNRRGIRPARVNALEAALQKCTGNPSAC